MRRCSKYDLWTIPVVWRRIGFVTICLLFTFSSVAAFGKNLFSGNFDTLRITTGMVFILLSFFGGFLLLSHVAGYFCLHSFNRRNQSIDVENSRIESRTALVMPIYNEDVARVKMGIGFIWRSVLESRLECHCDFYVLSDSTEDEIIQREEAMVQELRDQLFNEDYRDSGRIYLVRRSDRMNYKFGNIVNFAENHGSDYDFMMVLDADSLMSGGKIGQMIRQMQQRPKTGILQSLVLSIRSQTAFSRFVQFNNWRTTPMFLCGLYWLMEKNWLYWGHNALIRMKPFLAHCNMPIMPGKPPLGGRIMSHDIVEASLMERAGWNVEWTLDPNGSFDELPSNVITYAQRDQRWCQGNMQHFWLIFGDGFGMSSRFAFAFGIFTYAVSLIGLGLMVLGFVECLRTGYHRFGPIILWSLLINLPILNLVPRVLAFRLYYDRKQTMIKQVSVAILDVVVCYVVSPLLFYLHARFVLWLLMGRLVRWDPQSRDPRAGISWITAARTFSVPTLIAMAWIPMTIWLAPGFLIYSGLILFAWLFSIPVSYAISSPRLGDWLERHGIFQCPLKEEDLNILKNSGLMAEIN